MQDLRLLGVHEDGEHLLLADADGLRYQVAVDESLRAAVRRESPHLSRLQVERESSLRPRDVQALIRAGASAEEVAQRAGWSVDKVRRYEGPVLAEREYVATLARGARLRTRSVGAGGSNGSGSGSGMPALAVRVGERLAGRGVDAERVTWDSWRADDGPWTVVVTFAAGGRQRQASWQFDQVDRVVVAVDDEARWLSEDQPRTEGPLPPYRSAPPEVSERARSVYDVEAEGGVQSDPSAAEPVDLMTAMRLRTGARARRSSGSGRILRDPAPHPSQALLGEHDEELPLENMPGPGAPVQSPPVQSPPVQSPPVQSPPVQSPPVQRPPVQSPVAGVPGGRDDGQGRAADPSTGTDEAAGPQPAPRPTPTPAPSRRRAGRASGRPSVPSWDDIMFGTGQRSDGSS